MADASANGVTSTILALGAVIGTDSRLVCPVVFGMATITTTSRGTRQTGSISSRDHGVIMAVATSLVNVGKKSNIGMINNTNAKDRLYGPAMTRSRWRSLYVSFGR